MNAWTLLVVSVSIAASGCAQGPKAAPKRELVWHALGSWSGRGSSQTESLTTDSGFLRIRWDGKNASVGATLRLTAQSAISGRPLTTVVDQKGEGSGMSYLGEEPRVFYVLVESGNLDWSFTVEEGLLGSVTERD